MTTPNDSQKNNASTEATQEQLDAFIKRAGFSYGWQNLESWARTMARHAVEEINQAALSTHASKKHETNDSANEILKNLEYRLELAKRTEARMENTPLALQAEGARLEAWNSLQAAKTIHDETQSIKPAEALQLPSGFMLVPTEITKEMEDAFQKGFIAQLHKRRNIHGSIKHPMSAEAAGLHAMLKVAPQPSTQATPKRAEDTMSQEENKKTIEQKKAEADTAFEDYDFGDDGSVVHHDNWDTNDSKDLIKVVYMQFDGHPNDESEKVSFHVRFDENDNIEEVYALECRHGTEIGSYPKQKPSNNPGMGM